MRKCGILLPIASLPSPYGIGAFSKEAYQFVEELKEAGQTYWQILPLGATGYGDSPYQSFSTYAGNPYFIDLEGLIEEGLLTKEECDACDFGENETKIDYEKLYNNRFSLLRKAYERSQIEQHEDYQQFCREQAYWLSDYTLYMAIKEDIFHGKGLNEWDEEIRLRKPEVMEKYREELKESIGFYGFLQFKFKEQWLKLKRYANQKGIKIIGDLPIYVSFDSADTWANPKLFQLGGNGFPTAVAGCPPDAFAEKGQLWGNPLYRWEYHKETGYHWWIQRLKTCFELYDIVRIDHFRAFDEYYSIPYGDTTAEFGTWKKGVGMDLFHALKRELGEKEIIAEDLGYLTDSVKQLRKESGYPGMKILQFAFDSREESDYLPHNYERNCVVYTGTHDNDTIQGWFDTISEEDKKMAVRYMRLNEKERENLHWDFILLAQRSVANTCIIPMQDYLGLGHEARINTPSTLGGNWCWRLKKGEITKALLQEMREIAQICGRL